MHIILNGLSRLIAIILIETILQLEIMNTLWCAFGSIYLNTLFSESGPFFDFLLIKRFVIVLLQCDTTIHVV